MWLLGQEKNSMISLGDSVHSAALRYLGALGLIQLWDPYRYLPSYRSHTYVETPVYLHCRRTKAGRSYSKGNQTSRMHN